MCVKLEREGKKVINALDTVAAVDVEDAVMQKIKLSPTLNLCVLHAACSIWVNITTTRTGIQCLVVSLFCLLSNDIQV